MLRSISQIHLRIFRLSLDDVQNCLSPVSFAHPLYLGNRRLVVPLPAYLHQSCCRFRFTTQLQHSLLSVLLPAPADIASVFQSTFLSCRAEGAKLWPVSWIECTTESLSIMSSAYCFAALFTCSLPRPFRATLCAWKSRCKAYWGSGQSVTLQQWSGLLVWYLAQWQVLPKITFCVHSSLVTVAV